MSMLRDAARRVADLLGRDSGLVRLLRPLYEELLDWTTGGRGIPWTINGVEYRIDPRCRHMMGAAYDAHVAAWLSQRIQPGDLCIDVGANVGVYVLQLAHWSRPNGRVIAVEPNPRTREILRKHIRLNGLTDRVEVVAAAAGERLGEAELFAVDIDGMSRLGSPNPALEDQAIALPVPVITLDDLCETRRLDPRWLVIDIEGFEFSALLGARGLLSRKTARPGVVVEMHPDAWDAAGTSRAAAETLLREYGLKVEPLSGQDDAFTQHGHVALVSQ